MRLSVHDVAQLLNVSDKSVYRWVADSKIPAYRVGDQIRFSRPEIIEWATVKRISLPPAAYLEQGFPNLPLPSLAEAIEAGGILYRVQALDRDSALKAVVGALRLPAGIDSDLIFEMLRVREELGSTGVGDGIAIPHPRSPMLMHVDEPSVTLCFLEQPVEFNALDGKPVYALFTIMSPTARAHLQLLSRIAFALHDEGVGLAIRQRENRDVILGEIRRAERALTPLPSPDGSTSASGT